MRINGVNHGLQPQSQPKALPIDQSSEQPSRKGGVLRPWAPHMEATLQGAASVQYDSAPGAANDAINHYRNVDGQLKRQEINALFGVDLYA